MPWVKTVSSIRTPGTSALTSEMAVLGAFDYMAAAIASLHSVESSPPFKTPFATRSFNPFSKAMKTVKRVVLVQVPTSVDDRVKLVIVDGRSPSSRGAFGDGDDSA